MSIVADFIKSYFDYMVMAQFLVGGAFLVWVDRKKYKSATPTLAKEGSFALVSGVAYMVIGVLGYALAKLL